MDLQRNFIILFALTLATSPIYAGRNVDLSTVPKRNSVQLTIYNSEDLTLVRETRTITFKKGVNPLQFSWANTLIDPTSVELRFLTHPEKLEVLDTTYPHDKLEMLYWNVQSDFDGEATVEITYFTSGITWAADYLAIADNDEKNLKLEGFVRVTNHSGEEYENAQVRLVVGTINLVEKIAELAQIPMSVVSGLALPTSQPMRVRVLRKTFDSLDRAKAQNANGEIEESELKPKEIIKEGLSEYFIYTIEGTETIPNGWTKRLRSFEGESIPFKIQYRYRPREYGEQLVRMYLLTNDKASKLGTTPLPDGIVRVFRNNLAAQVGGKGRDGLSYLTQQTIKYIPIGDKIELNLGPDPSVLFDLIKLKSSRDNIWLQLNGSNVFKQVGQPGVQISVNSSVAGWDDHEIYSQRVRNYTDNPIDLEVRRSFDGHVIFQSGLKPILHNYQTVQFTATVDAGKIADLLYELLRHQGRNSKQNNVTLQDKAVPR
jgi:hypothetical protein